MVKINMLASHKYCGYWKWFILLQCQMLLRIEVLSIDMEDTLGCP